MHNNVTIIFVFILIYVGCCRDFYAGMFKMNDLLVAQDRLYKEKVPYRQVYAKYGRIFKCKITYIRIVNRLGYGASPKTEIVRGGLSHKYLVLRFTSAYNLPLSLNIYVGCANTFEAQTRAIQADKTTLLVTLDTQKEDNVTTLANAQKQDTITTIAAAGTAATVADAITTTAPPE